MTGAGLPAVQLDRVCWGPCGDAGILSGISFSVPQGQVMAICGVEGAGKSALLRLILRQQAPRQGTVRVADARGALEERKVELGVSNRVQAQVLSGLAEGERVVSGLVVGNGAGRPQMTPRL